MVKEAALTGLLILAGCVAHPGASAAPASEPPTMAETPAADAREPVLILTRPDLALSAPAPDEADALITRANFAEAMQKVEERQRVFGDASPNVSLRGRLAQGGLVFGQTLPGAKVRLDGEDVMVGADGRFVIGFGRDSALSALLAVTLPDGTVERIALDIEDRDFPVQRIDGLDQSKVSGFTAEQLEKIAVDSAAKKSARAITETAADWADGFDWPVRGPISGVFGSQRILNGEPKTPHSGLDVAAPAGTPVRAPAAGVVRLAASDMYFEGGLVLIDHGHWVESALMHLSRLDVAAGERVAKGDVIGAVGSTGRATGPHMHWSVRWAGTLVDPQLLTPAEDAPAKAPGGGPATADEGPEN